jgi:hypothetical protein
MDAVEIVVAGTVETEISSFICFCAGFDINDCGIYRCTIRCKKGKSVSETADRRTPIIKFGTVLIPPAAADCIVPFVSASVRL